MVNVQELLTQKGNSLKKVSMEKICLQVVDQDTVFYFSLCNAVLTPVFCSSVGVLYFVVSSERPGADDLQFASYKGLKHW